MVGPVQFQLWQHLDTSFPFFRGRPLCYTLVEMRVHYLFSLGAARFAGLMLSTSPVRAGEVLANPGFELGQTVFGWNTYGAISSYVLSQTSASIAHSGSNYLL